jgi:hypothetical protein
MTFVLVILPVNKCGRDLAETLTVWMGGDPSLRCVLRCKIEAAGCSMHWTSHWASLVIGHNMTVSLVLHLQLGIAWYR